MVGDKLLDVLMSLMGLVVALYGFILADIYQKLKALDDTKQDVRLCEEVKKNFIVELAKGDKKFDEVLIEIKSLISAMALTNQNLALAVQRLQAVEEKLPRLERRRDGD